MTSLAFTDAAAGGTASGTSTRGGATLVLTGTNLGGDGLGVSLTWNGAPLPGVRVVTPHTVLEVTVPPGPGGPISLALEIGGQSAAGSLAGLVPPPAYRVPSLQEPSLLGASVPFECLRAPGSALPVTGGGATLVLVGDNFGDGSATNVYVHRRA